jgi:CheY-like chemotaxis protein
MSSRQLQLHDRAVILMVDDNEHGLIARKNVLNQEGFDVLTARNAEAGLELLQDRHVDLVVTDYKMTGMNGLAFIVCLRENSPGTPVILLSGFVEPLGLDELSTGADAVLPKCANEAASLVRTVHRLLRRPARKPVAKEVRRRRLMARIIG